MKKQQENIVRYTIEELEKLGDRTDWDRVNSITDEELEEMVKNDPDDVYLTDEELKNGQLLTKGEWIKQFDEPQKKEQITLRLDGDVLDFFRQTGRGYQTRINNALRAFMKAHERPEHRSS